MTSRIAGRIAYVTTREIIPPTMNVLTIGLSMLCFPKFGFINFDKTSMSHVMLNFQRKKKGVRLSTP